MVTTKTAPAVQSIIRALVASCMTGVIVHKERSGSPLVLVQATVSGRVQPAFHAIDSGILYYCISQFSLTFPMLESSILSCAMSSIKYLAG